MKAMNDAATIKADLTLNETLKLNGYTTSGTGLYEKNIIRDGKIVFTGDSVAVWKWLADGCPSQEERDEDRRDRAEARRLCRAENGHPDA
jgi:hypothetical protein